MGKPIYIFFRSIYIDQGLSVTRSTPGMILFEYTGLLLFLPEAKTAATNLSFSFSFFFLFYIFFLRKENVLSRKTTSTITFALGSLCNTTTRKITLTRFLYFWLLPELAFKLCSCVQNTCLCYIKKKKESVAK